MASQDFGAVRQKIREILSKPEYDDGSAGPVLVRLAWHCSGTYDFETNTGGSNGATMRFAIEASDPANNGLNNARQFLEPVKEAFPWISYGDLWTLAGVEAIAAMGGPGIPWQGGRLDHTDDSNVPPNGRLPDASRGSDHIRNIFYRMGFSDQEIVALSGAHNLGRCHGKNSGFEGPWVPSPTKFGNTYFKLLVNAEWMKKTNSFGQLQFRDEDDELMMLPTDMALIADPIFRKHVEAYAKDKDLFYKDFSAAFAKLVELGIDRDAQGKVMKKGMQDNHQVWVKGEDREVTPRHQEVRSRL